MANLAVWPGRTVYSDKSDGDLRETDKLAQFA
jgi:hypothetical protein